MEITRQQNGDILTLKLVGRLDATWSAHVQNAISTGIRGGAHRIHLDMSEVPYLSSAGISSLLNAYKELAVIQGEFAIPRYSEAVRQVLDLSGLSNLLAGTSILPTAADKSARAESDAPVHSETTHASYESYRLGEFPPQQCRLLGQPTSLAHAVFAATDSHKIEFPDGSLGLGLGAFGSDYADCKNRFGEILALAGAGASQPTDGSQQPDYIISEGALIPAFNVLYGLSCHGKFSRLLRFESKADCERIGLEEITRHALDGSGASLAVVALVAETASLVGATLQRAPVEADASASLYDFPSVRDWFSFTAERAHIGGVSVVAGVIGRQIPESLIPFVRPIGRDAELKGHFHAAAFTYRPLKKGKIDLKETVGGLFQNQHLEGVLHLLADWREAHGAGESEFFRGACWVSPLEIA